MLLSIQFDQLGKLFEQGSRRKVQILRISTSGRSKNYEESLKLIFSQ